MKLKKGIKVCLSILLVILAGFITIKVIEHLPNTKFKEIIDIEDPIPKPPKEEKDPLEDIGYSKEDIKYLKQELSNDNLKYLLDNKIPKEDSLPIIKETYYIDEYLIKYLNYQKKKELSPKETIIHVNTHLDTPFYTNMENTDTSLGKFVILNKHYKADGSYPGNTLMTLNSKYSLYGTTYKLELNKECFDAFLEMYNDAAASGNAFKINSAYRSFDKQKRIYQGWVNKDGVKKADTYSARQGTSEHQTGYAFDIRDYPFTNDDYSKTKSFKWVSANAHKYGFIIRFPKGKEYITGYQYESWHYRYVGKEAAKYIKEHDLTFEEYYEYFIRFKNPRNLK